MKAKTYLLSAMLAGFLTSCGDNEEPMLVGTEPYYNIEVTVDGIELTGPTGTLSGDIPAEGIEFTVIPEEKFKDLAFLGYYNVHYLVPEKQYDSETIREFRTHPDIVREWGKVTYDFSVDPHKICFKINRNEKNDRRALEFCIGDPHHCVWLYLIQAAQETEEEQQ